MPCLAERTLPTTRVGLGQALVGLLEVDGVCAVGRPGRVAELAGELDHAGDSLPGG